MTHSPTVTLNDPSLRNDLTRAVRRRIDSADVEDIVQSILIEAITSKRLPAAPDEIRRFVFAIARQRIVDWYRAQDRERRAPAIEDAEPSELETTAANDLLEWAERTLRDAPAEGATQTFQWMLREGAGETLAEIAQSERVNPAAVRQRVSRLRRFFRERWTKEVAAIGLVGLVAIAIAFALGRADGTTRRSAPPVSPLAPSAEPPAPEPAPPAAAAPNRDEVPAVPAPPLSCAPVPSTPPPVRKRSPVPTLPSASSTPWKLRDRSDPWSSPSSSTTPSKGRDRRDPWSSTAPAPEQPLRRDPWE